MSLTSAQERPAHYKLWWQYSHNAPGTQLRDMLHADCQCLRNWSDRALIRSCIA